MSQTSGSSNKQTVTSLKSESDNLKFERKENDEDYNDVERSVHELLSSSGSSSPTESLSLVDTEEHDAGDTYEDSDDDPDMKLILDSLEGSTDTRMKRQNKTFSEDRIRDIERNNAILMQKILSHNHRATRFNVVPQQAKISSSAVNRKKQQKQIDHDNLILLRKIQTVKPFGLSHAKR